MRNDGREAPRALQAINDEVSNPKACGIAAIAFTDGEAVAAKHLQGKLVTIVKITIIAVSDGAKWSPVPATVQYTVVPAKGQDV